MSNNIKIVLNSAGINELLHSPEIKAQLLELGNAAAGRAGENFGAFPFEMPTRSVVRVSPINRAGALQNSEENTLLKALYGG